MPRIRVALLLAGIASLVIAASAFAATATAGKTKVTGGTTTITPSSATASSTGAFTFPITRGRINTTTLYGRLDHSGGIELSNGTDNVVVRHPVLISDKRGAYIWALVRGRSHRFCTGLRRHLRHGACYVVTRFREARILKITSGSVSGSTFTGNVAITDATASLINRLAGSKVAAGGEPLGTIAIAPTFATATSNS
jgi:hypothetical protein